MVIKQLLILGYIILCINVVDSARILAFFPFPSISHQVVFRKITLELVRRGHDVTVVTTDPAFPNGGAPSNLKEIDVHDLSYKEWQKMLQEADTKKFASFTEIRNSKGFMENLFKIHLENKEVQALLSDTSQKFDLILVEALLRYWFVFSHIYQAPMILVSSLGALVNFQESMGSLTHPLIYSSLFSFRIYNRTTWEKLQELYVYYSVEYAYYLNEDYENNVIRANLGPNIPSLRELYNNIDMLFINLHPIWADNQPVPPNIIYMGGIHQLPEKELPNDLKTYLESSKHGVIYFSFGTNVLSGLVPPDKLQILVKVLSNLPYDVLFKWDKDELPGKSNNIKISKWFPQSDLLRHPKIKLFIMQGGLQSTDEAITGGVPLVAIPMLGDQWYNAEKYVKYGIGKTLNIETLTENIFKDAVETVINDESYRKNIVKLRQLMRDQPETPLERVVWWTEYVIRHGGAKQLRAASANKSYAEYFELELILIVLLVFLILSVVLILAVVRVIKFLNYLRSSTKIKIKVN